MYNVMIVDDELWFRSYLKELIDQSGSEFLVCAQAANGAEALKILAAAAGRCCDRGCADAGHGRGRADAASFRPAAPAARCLALSNCDDYLHVRQMLQLARRTICSSMRSVPRLCGSIFSAPPTGSGSRPR